MKSISSVSGRGDGIYAKRHACHDKQIQGIRSDRAPQELWREVRDTVQDAVINQDHLQEKEMQKGKMAV